MCAKKEGKIEEGMPPQKGKRGVEQNFALSAAWAPPSTPPPPPAQLFTLEPTGINTVLPYQSALSKQCLTCKLKLWTPRSKSCLLAAVLLMSRIPMRELSVCSTICIHNDYEKMNMRDRREEVCEFYETMHNTCKDRKYGT